MGRVDGGDDRSAALCLRWWYHTAHPAMASGRHEHGKRSCIYDHRACNEDHESWCAEDRIWNKKVPAVSGICDGVRVSYRGSCESGHIGKRGLKSRQRQVFNKTDYKFIIGTRYLTI